MATEESLPADDGALERLLRERSFGPTAPDEVTPWDFVLAWPESAMRKRVWPIVSRLLLDSDERVRTRAVELARRWEAGRNVAIPRLLDAVEQHIDLFARPVVEGVPLRDTVAHALSDRAAVDPARVVAQLKRLAAGGLPGGGAASVLGERDPQFVIQVAQRAGDDAVDWLEEAARALALFRRDDVVPFLEALRRRPAATRERLLAVVEQYVQRDDKKAAAIAGADGVPPPAGPAPSPDACRRAIGLS